MNQAILSERDLQITRQVWFWVSLCICVLMVATLSSPEDYKTSRYGVQSLLPPGQLSLIKKVLRGSVILIIAYCLYLTWHFPRRRMTTRRTIPLLAFTAFAILSAAWSAEKGISLGQAATFGTLVALASLIATIWNSEKDTSRLLQCGSWMLLLIAAGLLVFRFAKPEYGALTRNSAGLFHSTNAGACASLGILILLASKLIWGWSWASQLLVPGILLHASVMAVGANRMSVIALMVVGLVLFVAVAEKIWIALATLGAATALVIYLCLDPGLTLADGVTAKVASLAAQGQSSAQLSNLSGRAEVWEKIWDSFCESPLIGHGYFVTSAEGQIYVWGEWGNWTAHNFCLQLLATVGLCGALLLMMGLGNIAVRVFLKIGRGDRTTRQLSSFLFFGGLWYLVWGLMNESFLGPLQPESVIFAVMLGLAIVVACDKSNPVRVAGTLSGVAEVTP